MPLPTTDDIRDAVLRALDRLTNEDAHLFKVNISERSLTFRLGFYLQCEFPDWRVDSEYNRNGDYPKRLIEVKRQRLSERPTSETKGDVYPDIIVHCRGGNGPNLLAIEAKKQSELTSKDRDFDYLKLRGYRDDYGYCSVAFVVFGSDPDQPSYTVEFNV